MNESRVNKASRRALLVTSSATLLTILVGLVVPHPRPETDEGTLAHLFQVAAVASATTLLVYLVTADWRAPGPVVRRIVLPIALLVLAFGALYYLEHLR